MKYFKGYLYLFCNLNLSCSSPFGHISVLSPIGLWNLYDLASWRELADLHRKAVYDVLERNLSHLDSVLETLTVDRYSMSVVAVLFVKMNQTYTDSVKERV